MKKRVLLPILLVSLRLAAFDAALLQAELPLDDVDQEQAYERKRTLLSESDKKALSQDDLKELMALAKDRNDFETHAQAYHRWKLEVATEDNGSTVVIKLKQMTIPVTLAALVGGGLVYLLREKKWL